MAMHLSIDEKNRHGQVVGAARTRAASVAWIFARPAAICIFLKRVVAGTLEKIKSAQGRSDKRKQMALVESLPLGNRRQLILVVCNNEKYLVGAGPDSVGDILALKPGAASWERPAKGPELVRRRGRDAAREKRSKTMSRAGSSPWR